jgi:multidrug transporter EmrE-like cation transporter
MSVASKVLRFGVPWLLLIAFETGSQLSLKAGSAGLAGETLQWIWFVDAAARPLIWLGVVCYIASFVMWMTILSRLPLGVAFPASAMVFIVVIVASYLIFGEAINLLQFLGFALILGGVLLL